MCSLCVIKSHKLHDVIMCSELATSKEREHASNRIGNICQKVYDQMQRMEAIEEGLSLEIDQIRKVSFWTINLIGIGNMGIYCTYKGTYQTQWKFAKETLLELMSVTGIIIFVR